MKSALLGLTAALGIACLASPALAGSDNSLSCQWSCSPGKESPDQLIAGQNGATLQFDASHHLAPGASVTNYNGTVNQTTNINGNVLESGSTNMNDVSSTTTVVNARHSRVTTSSSTSQSSGTTDQSSSSSNDTGKVIDVNTTGH